jgi:dienelactone hydrolase
MLFRAIACLAVASLVVLAAKSAEADPKQLSFPGAEGVTLKGWLYTPEKPGRHRAIVALHGCSGLLGNDGLPSPRHADWAERWAKAGFIALFPDSFGSRGLGPQCKNADRTVHPARERVDDANAALLFLSKRDDVDPHQISLIGWSNGGSSTLYAVQPRNSPSKANGGVDFVRAIAFYPGCRLPLETGRWRTRIPLLVLIGAADDWTPAAPCSDLIADAKSKNEPAEIVTYPDAYHDFDHPDMPVHTLEGLAFTGDGDGQAHTGTNLAARAEVIVRVMKYLGQ